MCADLKHPQIRHVLVIAALLSASACQKSSADLEWARSALERNPQVEVLASDPRTNVLTIRIKATNTIRTVKLEELAATPQDLLGSPLQTTRTQVETPSATSVEATSNGSPVESAPPADAPPSPVPTAAPVPPAQQLSAPAYKIARENGQVRVSGPGVSIVSVPDAKTESVPGTPFTDPIVCEGRRFMHLDSRNINVAGDAVIARNGCELHVTNSRISAIAGAGITVENATVHIANSQVKGTDASVDAGDGAKLFIRGSTFDGMLKRSDTAAIQESGGNEWK